MSESSSEAENKTDLPPPLEIAKIAAVLCWDSGLDKKAAIEQAIILCLKAAIRYGELVPLTLDQIISELGDAPLLDWALENMKPAKKLRLYPDDARLDL